MPTRRKNRVCPYFWSARSRPSPGLYFRAMTAARHSRTFRRMYDALVGHFGLQGWWPSAAGCETAEGKVEICVGSILTQNTNWGNVERAIENLRQADCLSVEALRSMRAPRLAKLIRPSGYFNVKAKRLKNFVKAVVEEANGDIVAFLNTPKSKLRAELLSINGVGPETADSMILYAAGQATFVIDAYTMRVFRRHGLLDEKAHYDDAKEMFEAALPTDAALFNEFHAQIVAAGKRYCRRRPRCATCPLARFRRSVTAD